MFNKKEYAKKWNDEHPENRKKSMKKYYEKNKNSVLAQQREYYEANKEKKVAYQKQYNIDNKEKRSAWKKDHYAKNRDAIIEKRYSLHPGEYEALLVLQDRKCAICADRRRLNGRRLVVDHDHKTGRVRKLLCDACNTTLGLLGESVDYIDQLKSYILNNN